MSRTPRYHEVAVQLETEIASTPPNSIIPTEKELARRFGVSRVTIRMALGLLERGGLVSRHRGRGTMVSPAKVTRRLVPLRTIEEDFREQGIKLETRVLEYRRRAVPPISIRALLGLRASESAGFLWLARVVDGRVVCDDRRYLASFVANRFEPDLVQSRPISDILRELTALPVKRVDWDTEITRATPEVAAGLGITPGVLVVSNTSTEYLSDGRRVEAYTMSYRVDRVRFRFSVSGDTSAYASGESARSHRARRAAQAVPSDK